VSYDGTVKIWDSDTGECLSTLTGHTGNILEVIWSPDKSGRLASRSYNEKIKIWDSNTGRCLSTVTGHSELVNSVDWSKDGRKLASASNDISVKIWDSATGRCLSKLEGHIGGVSLVTWSSAENERLASISKDKTFRIWDVEKGQCIFYLGGCCLPEQTISPSLTAVSWSPDGRKFKFATANLGCGIEAWESFAGDHEFLLGLEAYSSKSASNSWSKDGGRLASATHDGNILIWDIWHQNPFFSIRGGHSGDVNSVAWSQDGTRLASSAKDTTIKIWDTETSHTPSKIPTHTRLVKSMAWSPDGKRLASASQDRTIKIWDSTTGECIFNFEEDNIQPYSVTWSQDGSRLSLASFNRRPGVWDMETGERTLAMGGNEPHRVESHAWSPDGKKLAVGLSDCTVHIWNLNQEKLGFISMLHDWQHDDIVLVDWSPDGSQLASKSGNGTIRVWDIVTTQCRATLIDEDSIERCGTADIIAWSADKSVLAWCQVEGSESATRVWDLTTGEMIYICRQLTPQTSFLKFDDKISNLLHTSWGVLDISCADLHATSHRISTYSSGPRGYDLSEDGVWITYKGTNILWLPPEYRSNDRSVAAISGTNVAINCPSHRIMIVQFTEQNPVVPP
jgi:WD40 repeat protein